MREHHGIAVDAAVLYARLERLTSQLSELKRLRARVLELERSAENWSIEGSSSSGSDKSPRPWSPSRLRCTWQHRNSRSKIPFHLSGPICRRPRHACPAPLRKRALRRFSIRAPEI